jgi:L-gulonolactone oxidase
MTRPTPWRNWTGDQTCTPAVIERPSNTAGVVAAIERAAEAGRQVRVAGAGHSFTDAVLTDGTLLTLENMRRIVDVDRASGQVRVEAGITLGELAGAMWDHGLAFENLGDIGAQSIAGATATGTHGTGARLRNLSAALHSIELVTGEGQIVELSAERDPDAWRAARVSVGALGAVTTVTLQAVPAFVLEGVDVGRPLHQVLGSLDELVDGNDHFEFYTFPHSPLALTRSNNRVDLDPRPPRALWHWAEEVLVRNHALATVCARARPAVFDPSPQSRGLAAGGGREPPHRPLLPDLHRRSACPLHGDGVRHPPPARHRRPDGREGHRRAPPVRRVVPHRGALRGR